MELQFAFMSIAIFILGLCALYYTTRQLIRNIKFWLRRKKIYHPSWAKDGARVVVINSLGEDMRYLGMTGMVTGVKQSAETIWVEFDNGAKHDFFECQLAIPDEFEIAMHNFNGDFEWARDRIYKLYNTNVSDDIPMLTMSLDEMIDKKMEEERKHRSLWKKILSWYRA